MPKQNSTRREFIKGAAIAGTAGVAGGLLLQNSSCARGGSIEWNKEADVVVIGAGATGLSAAIEAAEAASSVILVEANFDIGGHAIVSGGNIIKVGLYFSGKIII